jgi:hypothetical protein
MPIIRKKLDENAVYPTNLRYNEETDTVQSLVNGVWTDNPQADPRNQTTLPARITDNTRCDGAQSVSDALQNQISGIIDAIEAASTLFTIAGLILGIFTFGTFDIFISLALTLGGAMVDAGAPSLETALTPATFEALKCILFCHFENNGRIGDVALTEAMADVDDQIGGLGAFVINSMLALAGAGGVNNLAALGTATGDCTLCDECPEEWCFSFEFALSDGGWSVVPGQVGQYNPGVGWGAATSSNYRFVEIEIEFPPTQITAFGIGSAIILDPRTATPLGDTDFVDIDGHILSTPVLSPPPNPWLWSGDKPGATKIQVQLMCGIVTPAEAPAGGEVNISSIQVRGVGECPFGTPNCE